MSNKRNMWKVIYNILKEKKLPLWVVGLIVLGILALNYMTDRCQSLESIVPADVEVANESQESGMTSNKHKTSNQEEPEEYIRQGNIRQYELPAIGRGENVVAHTGYVLSYNSETNCPNWVAWELTKEEASARRKRNDEFYQDTKVDSRHQVTSDDYRGSGYSRGHMCPAGDMKWSGAAQHDCFYMTNMCPQNRELNGNSWEELESACRRWAKQEGSVYIVCGPFFNEKRKVRTIGREHKVRVPDGFFKVVLSLKHNNEKAIGFYYANNDRYQPMEAQAMTVDEVEQMTGYDFFHFVNDKLEDRVEASFNLRDWK